MRNAIAVMVCGLVLAAAGCQNNDYDDVKADRSEMDACPRCDGVQNLTTNGRCEQCGTKLPGDTVQDDALRGSNLPAETPPRDSVSAVDVCDHCEGVQVANAEGECPVCGMEVAAD